MTQWYPAANHIISKLVVQIPFLHFASNMENSTERESVRKYGDYFDAIFRKQTPTKLVEVMYSVLGLLVDLDEQNNIQNLVRQTYFEVIQQQLDGLKK
jgi:hypothetical protein